MSKSLREFIHGHRSKLNMTQDQFAVRYGISGPAVFKFEKGYVRPSLKLWMLISEDIGIPAAKAVLIHIQSKLPQEFHDLFNPESRKFAFKRASKGKRAGKVDYRSITDRRALKAAAKADRSLPKALRDFLSADDVWRSFKPTGLEIAVLSEAFGSLGRGTTISYREALRLIRSFTSPS